MQLTGLDHSELLAENLAPEASAIAPDVLHGLTHLAMARSERIHLTTELFESLRKLSGQEVAREYLGAIQILASEGTPAGARLLSAFLNVASPGERLLPRLRELDSSRRYAVGMRNAPGGLGASQGDWLARQQKLQITAKLWVAETELLVLPSRPGNPRDEEPWPLLRAVFADLLERTTIDGFDGPERGPQLLIDLMRLETDAWQERTSQLAGSVHPFKVETVARVLPMLNRIDGQIRDVRQMIGAAAEGDLEGAFLRPQARWREVLDDKDWRHLERDLAADPGLAALARLAKGLAERPIPVPQLAAGISRIRRLSAALAAEGLREDELDLLTACVLVQTHYANGQLAFTLNEELATDVQGVLDAADAAGEPLPGMEVVAGLLMMDLVGAEESPAHGLPHVREMNEAEEVALKHWRKANAEVDPTDLEAMREEALALARKLEGDDDDDEEVIDMDTAALKHLVLTNIQSVSVLLGFLRNPKVYAIPGLVEDVVNRTRNPQIIETIANDRALHRGFANKGVPLACLRSPINVSVKVLRKFCHVKYVSKIDLKRLSADRTGIRKEVAREIEKYLEALA